jgi:outer membrane protein TolC
MTHSYKGQIVALLVIAALVLSGCVGKEDYYEEITLSRDTAYQRWQGQRQTENQLQPVISGELALDDCLKLTIANNKLLQRTLQEKEIARGGEMGSLSAVLPSVDVTAGYERLDQVSSFTIADRKITLGDVDNYSAGLRVTQPIFAGAAIPARINAGRLTTLLSDQTVRATLQQVVYAAVHGYYDVLLNQHLCTIGEDAVRSSQAHLDSVKQKRQGGIASDFDVLRAEVELSNFEAELIRNQNAINIARANLLKTMGVAQDSNVILSNELTYIPLETTLDRAVWTAFKTRPELFSAELQIKLQREMLAISDSRYWPVISGYYNNLWSQPDPHNIMLIEWGRAWNAGLTAAWPLFDGFAREGDVIAQKARVKQAQVDLIDAEETAIFELNKAILSIGDADRFVQSQQLNLTRAEEGLRLAEVGYREGTNTQVEMIDAQAALTTAKANYYQAIYSHLVAKLDLHKAMGTITGVEKTDFENKDRPASLNNNIQEPQR